MVATAQGSDVVARARKSDREFDDMMCQVDRFGADVHLIQAIQKAAATAYNLGYLNGYTAAQSNVREALGIPERD